MNRYFYYNMILVNMMNIVFYVPKILIHFRYTGAVSALLVGGVIGTVMAWFYLSALNRFPGKGLPEIFEASYPKGVSRVISFILGIHWFSAATLPLVDYSYVLTRFLNPDASPLVILILIALACAYAATRSTLTVMLLAEIGLILVAPLTIFIMGKALTNHDFSWDAVRTIANYVTVAPHFTAVSAASYLFVGFMHMSIYNRLFPPNFRYRHQYWLFPLIGFSFLFVSFFVPIGFHGTEAVAKYLYIWTVTADSMVMSYGFLERVIYLFLFVFLNLSLIHNMSVWHQSMEFFKSAISKQQPKVDPPETPLANYIICGLFFIATIVFQLLTDERTDYNLTVLWLKIRFVIEILLVVWIFILSRKGGNKHEARTSS